MRSTRWNLTLLLAATVPLAIAGCMENTALGAHDAELVFDGKGSGSHSETTDCDDQGTVAGSGQLHDGQVQVTVTDGGGDTLFQKAFSGEFKLDAKSISGASGTWKIEAERAGDDLAGDDFNGGYEFTLDC